MIRKISLKTTFYNTIMNRKDVNILIVGDEANQIGGKMEPTIAKNRKKNMPTKKQSP